MVAQSESGIGNMDAPRSNLKPGRSFEIGCSVISSDLFSPQGCLWAVRGFRVKGHVSGGSGDEIEIANSIELVNFP